MACLAMAARTETAIVMPPADRFLPRLSQDLDSTQPMFVELLLCAKNFKGKPPERTVVWGALFAFQEGFSPT